MNNIRIQTRVEAVEVVLNDEISVLFQPTDRNGITVTLLTVGKPDVITSIRPQDFKEFITALQKVAGL